MTTKSKNIFWKLKGIILIDLVVVSYLQDLKDSIVKGLGFQADGFKVSGFDMRDALVGRSVAYEFDIEIDNKVLPFKLLEDVHRWEYVDLPIFRVEDSVPDTYEEKRVINKQKIDEGLPVLAPFQLAGPMELWIQDADDMRISLPVSKDFFFLLMAYLSSF